MRYSIFRKTSKYTRVCCYRQENIEMNHSYFGVYKTKGSEDMLQDTLKALSDPTRRKILEMLKKGPLSAGEIGEHFDMTGATLSHHLSILKKAGLVDDNKKGTFVYYEINTSVMEDILAWITGLMGEKKDEI